MIQRLFSVLVSIAWPFLIYLMIHYQINHQWLWGIALILGIHIICRIKTRTYWYQIGPTAVLMILVILGATFQKNTFLYFYPVFVNLFLFSIFASSLLSGHPIIERFARLKTPVLSDFAVRYTQKVTQIWCCFFVINGSIALATCLYGDAAIWMYWNGILSYCCIGLLMLIEYCVRIRLRKKYEKN